MFIYKVYIQYTSGLYIIYIGYNNIDINIIIDIVLFHFLMDNILKDIEDLFEYIYIYYCFYFVEESINITFNPYIILINNEYLKNI